MIIMFKTKKFLSSAFFSSLFFLNIVCSAPIMRMASRVCAIPSRSFVQLRNISSSDQRNDRLIKILFHVHNLLLNSDVDSYLKNKRLLEMLCVANIILHAQKHHACVPQSDPFENAIKSLFDEYDVFSADEHIRSAIALRIVIILELHGFKEEDYIFVMKRYLQKIDQVVDGGVADGETFLVLKLVEGHLNRNFTSSLSLAAARMGLSLPEMKDRIFRLVYQKVDTLESVEEIARKIVSKLFKTNLD